MRRREFLAGAASLAAPRVASGQGARILKFVPFSEPPVLDPIVTRNAAVRNHALMVFDTLYGLDESWQPQPQMAAGHRTEDNGRIWTIGLREGLRFHDGTPVLGRDVVQSIRRWGERDDFGSALMAVTDALDAPSDRAIQFRLKRPFPLLLHALGKASSNIPVIMPERLARTDSRTAISEVIGSGPYRYVAGERVPGSLTVYERFLDYRPRDTGTPSLLAGPKHAHFERIEWRAIPDAATASGALQRGEVDWVEMVPADYRPVLEARRLTVEVLDRSGAFNYVRFNFLNPPFDNPRVRHAALAAISQTEAMQAAVGADPRLWRTGVGFFHPDSPMASDVATSMLKDPPDREEAKRLLARSGYGGEPVALMAAATVPRLNATALVVEQAWRQIGFKVDLQSADVAAFLRRLENKGPVDKGGWSAVTDGASGPGAVYDPAGYAMIRGNGAKAAYGWPDIPELESLRDSWFEAPDDAARRAICARIEAVCLETLPIVPLGVSYVLTAYRSTLSGVLKGMPLFWNVKSS